MNNLFAAKEKKNNYDPSIFMKNAIFEFDLIKKNSNTAENVDENKSPNYDNLHNLYFSNYPENGVKSGSSSEDQKSRHKPIVNLNLEDINFAEDFKKIKNENDFMDQEEESGRHLGVSYPSLQSVLNINSYNNPDTSNIFAKAKTIVNKDINSLNFPFNNDNQHSYVQSQSHKKIELEDLFNNSDLLINRNKVNINVNKGPKDPFQDFY